LSLSPVTVNPWLYFYEVDFQIDGASRALALYFQFLAEYCQAQKLEEYGIESLMKLQTPERHAKVGELTADFVVYLKVHYKPTYKSVLKKKVKALEPETILKYSSALFLSASLWHS
jgi:hypothetical protein